MCSSDLFISASCFGFGLYNYMEASLPPWSPGFGSSLGWIPLTCVLIFTLFFSIGNTAIAHGARMVNILALNL